MKQRWILIDSHSGYIWGDSASMPDFDGSAVDYAKALDESLGEHGRTYEHTASSLARQLGLEGYFVYAVGDGLDEYGDPPPVVEDGQDQETIRLVKSNCRRCGFIVTSRTDR